MLVIALSLVAVREFEYPFGSKFEDDLLEVLCLAISMQGLIIRMFTIGCIPEGISGRNTNGQLAEKIDTMNMYSIVRNPLYLHRALFSTGY